MKPAAQCRYFRTTWLLNAKTPLNFPDSSRISFLDEFEAAKFVGQLRNRSTIARIKGERDFYVKRATALAHRTIIEVFRFMSPDDMTEQGEQVVELIEKLSVLSTTLFLRKDVLLRKLGISTNVRPEINFTLTSQLRTIRSRSHRVPIVEGITIDRQFSNRFSKSGFFQLFQYCQSQSDLAKRVRTSADWLLESRRETRLTASVVKTAIALESLLIFNESESLARSLSERTAFILSASPEKRHEISRIINQFYEVRSGVVHGSQKKAKKLTPSLVECVDRLVLFLHLMISANSHLWPGVESLRLWCEKQRWGKPYTEVKAPFSQLYLRSAMALAATGQQVIANK